jgi:predicted acyltransferase
VAPINVGLHALFFDFWINGRRRDYNKSVFPHFRHKSPICAEIPAMSEVAEERPPARLVSLDAYRGFTMLLMASAGFGITRMASNDSFTEHQILERLAYQFQHVVWRGCSLWDMIQPSFMFIVGVAMPFSYARRQTEGQPRGRQFVHALVRSIALVVLGVFLASQGHRHTNFSFMNVLAQIGLGYMVVFLLLGTPVAVQVGAIIAILAGYWALFAFYPLPGLGFQWATVGIPPSWDHLQGFAAHWEKNINVAAIFDRWFLNLFPGPEGKPFFYNPEGYATLNFVPSIATMLLGVLAGRLLRSDRAPHEKITLLLIAGTLGVVAGSSLDPQYCPIVKRIWTPSWTIYSAGWASLELMAFYWLFDVLRLRFLAFPLVVVGMNSIAMYLMAQLTRGWVLSTLKIHLGGTMALISRSGFVSAHNVQLYRPMIHSLAVLFVWWLACFWMYRRKIFVRI